MTKNKHFVALIKKIKSRQILKLALQHNRREHISGRCLYIDRNRTGLNYSINSNLSTDQIMEFAFDQIKNSGAKLRKNSVYTIEIVISLSTFDIDYRSFFDDVYKWALAYYKLPILSCEVHLDEARPHVHLLLLPLRGGRMVGSSIVGYKWEMARFKKSIYDNVGKKFGLSPIFKDASSENAEIIIQRLEGDSIRKSNYWHFFTQIIREKPKLFEGILNV